jgi:hypothetical protein
VFQGGFKVAGGHGYRLDPWWICEF